MTPVGEKVGRSARPALGGRDWPIAELGREDDGAGFGAIELKPDDDGGRIEVGRAESEFGGSHCS
jgi:hypothetical protein